MTMRDKASDDLLAAYVDGVSELSPAEREGIETRLRADGELRAEELATRSVIDQLRELGSAERDRAEPSLDWAAMERSIRDAVGPDVPRPWWRRWQWVVPGMASLALATAVLVVVVRAPSAVETGGSGPVVHDAAVVAAVRDPAPPREKAEPPAVVWLDGMDVELGPEADAALDDLEGKHRFADASLDLVVSDLAWVDDLDDSELDGIERALESEATRRKKG